MKEILGKYKDRLVNLSGKNRSLVMKKLYKKRAFDIYNLKEFNENIYKDILDYINDENKNKCCIVDDYSAFYSQEKSKLDKIYKEKVKQLAEYEKRIEDAEFNKEFLDKKQRLEENYQKVSEKIEKKRDKLISYGQSLKALRKEINDIEKETGKRELYLAYPFVEGRFKDGTFFKAPLMLYQVSLETEGDKWFIKRNGDSKISINKVFLLAIEKYNELKIEGIEEEYQDLSQKTIEEVIEKISKFGVYFNVEFNDLEKVTEYTSKNTPRYEFGTAKLVENIVIGQFPLSNSIHKDYEELIGKDLNNKLLESLLKTRAGETREVEFKEEDGKLSFSENDLFFISQLDYSQELAVKRSAESDKLVIYGPPGTGKSQTITNIISNSIANNKKVLMVSQKRAALDVIYNRLGDLNSRAIIIHDVNADKKKFYNTVSTSLGAEFSENSDKLYEIIEDSKQIDREILKLEKLAKVLNQEREIGLSLQQMYSKSKKIESNDDFKLHKFVKYRKFAAKNGIDRLKYDELVSTIEKLDGDVINSFLEYQKLKDKNKEIENIDISMDNIEILEAISESESILEKEDIIKSINEKEKTLFDEFYNTVLEKRKVLLVDEVKNLSKKINERNNKSLMVSKNSGVWWNLDSNEDECAEVALFLKKKDYIFEKEDIIELSDRYNDNKNENLKVKLNNENWWKSISGDNDIKEIVYSNLKKTDFKFNESDVEEKCIEVYKEKNNYLLDEIVEKSFIKRIFNKSKNKRKEEENKKAFYDGLEKCKKESKSIGKELVDKYFENINKEKENLIKFEKARDEYREKFSSLAIRISEKYQENLRIDKENQIKLEEEYQRIFKVINNLNLLLEENLSSLEVIKNAFNNEKFEFLKGEVLKSRCIKKELENLIEALKMLERYHVDIKRVSELSQLQKNILTNSILEDGTIEESDIKNIVEFSILQNILILEKNPDVQEAIEYIDKFEDIVDDTNGRMKLKQRLVKEFIINKCQDEIEKLKYEKSYREFKRQADKKRALWPIRQYIEKYTDEVLSVFSCFLLGPETVSDVLPLVQGLFDVVIFDEASQMFIEDAIPTIYRAKKVIVAGDDKQLRPTGTFKSTISSDLDGEEEAEDLAALEEESLLDLAKINYDKVHLTYHYRSQYEELISFSNYAFYNGRLKVSPNKISSDNEFRPIERIKCRGRWVDRTNIEEAKEVVDLVYKILLERKENETLGIITFNINQKGVIEDMLELKAQNDPVFRALYVKEIERIENSEDVSLFVKNIENVQGDERDIIIFSTGYSRNENGRLSVNFGSLSQEGGENRLNVAISRAKKKIYVITSIEPEELNVDNSKNLGPRLFKKYLQYVRAVSKGNKDEAEIILNSLIDSDIVRNEERQHDSDFEAEVYDALVERGYEVHTQVGVSGYKIDMAIYDREKDEYILGIECDGATFHSSKSARERDIHRQRYLESRGWKITRIWSRHWWKNPKGEIDKIVEKLQDIKNLY